MTNAHHCVFEASRVKRILKYNRHSCSLIETTLLFNSFAIIISRLFIATNKISNFFHIILNCMDAIMRTEESKTRDKVNEVDGRTHVFWRCCCAAHGKGSALKTKWLRETIPTQWMGRCADDCDGKNFPENKNWRRRDKYGGVLTPLKSNVNDNKNEKCNSLRAIKISYVLPFSARSPPQCSFLVSYSQRISTTTDPWTFNARNLPSIRAIPAIRAALTNGWKLLFLSRVSRFTFTIFMADG